MQIELPSATKKKGARRQQVLKKKTFRQKDDLLRDSQGTEHMAALGLPPPTTGDLPSQHVIEEQTESHIMMTGSQKGMRTFDSGKSDLIKVVSVNQLNKEC